MSRSGTIGLVLACAMMALSVRVAEAQSFEKVQDGIVVRIGADLGLRCLGCNHKVLLPRRELEKRLKTFVARGPEWTDAPTPVESVDPS